MPPKCRPTFRGHNGFVDAKMPFSRTGPVIVFLVLRISM
jgi:hypothetical protein